MMRVYLYSDPYAGNSLGQLEKIYTQNVSIDLKYGPQIGFVDNHGTSYKIRKGDIHKPTNRVITDITVSD